MKEKSSRMWGWKKKAAVIVLAGLAAAGAAAVVNVFRNEDARWAQRQRAGIVSAGCAQNADANYRAVQEKIYDGSLQDSLSEEVIVGLQDSLNISDLQARSLAQSQSEFYSFLRRNYASGVDRKRIEDDALTSQGNALEQQLGNSLKSCGVSFDEDVLDRAMLGFAVGGYKGRWTGQKRVGDFRFEAPAYNFYSDLLKNPRRKYLYNLTWPPFRLSFEYVAQKADKNNDKLITVREAIDQLREELKGIK